MNVMVLGSGAREHALAWKLASSRAVERVFAAPGNAGSSPVATALPDVDPARFETVLAACRSSAIDCVMVGPEAPLAAGVVDFLAAHGIAAIGPGKRAAQLEASKAFAKDLLVRNGIPTAEAARIGDRGALERYLAARRGARLVVKKSGLAAGKGVLVSADYDEMLAFGGEILEGGDELLVEECLEGWEVSVFGLSDGSSHVVLPPCTDFKRAHDGDQGPNTGGMGSICPVPRADEELMGRVQREIVAPTYAALGREGLGYAGVLYFGLMVTAAGPRVLEFNVRFGDPETQVLLPMLDADLGELLGALASRGLARLAGGPAGRIRARRGAALGVVVAGRGYPQSHAPLAPVAPIAALDPAEALVFHASSRRDAAGRMVAGGGRCFTVVGLGADLAEARRRAYAAAPAVRFDGAWYRGDIGAAFIPGGRP